MTPKEKAIQHYCNRKKMTDSLHQRTCYCEEAIDVALKEQPLFLVEKIEKEIQNCINLEKKATDIHIRTAYIVRIDALRWVLEEITHKIKV